MGTWAKKALRANHNRTAESFPMLHSIASLLNLRCASRKMYTLWLSSESKCLNFAPIICSLQGTCGFHTRSSQIRSIGLLAHPLRSSLHGCRDSNRCSEIPYPLEDCTEYRDDGYNPKLLASSTSPTGF